LSGGGGGGGTMGGGGDSGLVYVFVYALADADDGRERDRVTVRERERDSAEVCVNNCTQQTFKTQKTVLVDTYAHISFVFASRIRIRVPIYTAAT